jgi:uncharacterized membrane protein
LKTTITAIVGLLVIMGGVYGAKITIDSEHMLLIAQSAKAIQSGVSANQLQMMQWELNDIIARAAAGKAQVGDVSRRLVLESRIKELAKK